MQNRPALIDGSPDDASGRRFKPRVVDSHLGSGPDARCDIRLTLPACAENVVLIRHMVGALAQAIALPPTRSEDIKLAVTEACTNVVRHAYSGEQGTLDVAALADDRGLEITITDHGDGIRPHPPSEGGPGLGLPLMAAIAYEFEIDQTRAGGTRVRMSFPVAE
jgi:anti-sigma regulatory factor (Ser/Thr protein kinase)